MLIDTVTITVSAGNGGNGRVSFRRNAQTAKGGPDGGNGGKGGDVYIQGIDDILGLRDFQYKKQLYAENGVNGGKQNLFGRGGKDLVIYIPLGTIITDTQTGEQFEMQNTTDQLLIVKGGEGGRGNNEFKSATNQTPYFAEKGKPGEVKQLHLELKLIADVGLIGLPNAGKSSLLAALTNAKPKIGNYPFTTLEPNIGMLNRLSLADIPGLIEGAHEGKGLGIQFLRHIEKTKLLLHCISVENVDPLATYYIVRKELEEYEKILLDKKEIILLTKIDLVDAKIVKGKIKQLKKTKREIIPLSVYNKNNLESLQTFLEKQ